MMRWLQLKLFKFGHCRYVFLKAVSRVTEEEMNCLFLSIVAISLLFDLGSAFHGLKSNSALITSSLKVGAPLSSSSSLGMFKKKESKPAVDPADYWQGEWICADCGYIYDRDVDGGGLYFEELKKGFICPQCSAPRRRYAKKVGDQWGITRDGGDFPIYFMTFLGLAATTWFSLVYVPTL